MNTPIKKPALGRGLESLLGPIGRDQASGEHSIKEVAVEELFPSANQTRRDFNQEKLTELAISIKELGILNPLIVKPVDTNGQYELIAGERRWRAAQIAGLTKVPVIVKSFTELKSFEATLIENIQRSDLTALEEAEGYQKYMQVFNVSAEALAMKIGKSRSYVVNSLRLLNLPENIKKYLEAGKISAGHARALLSVENPEALVAEIVEKGLNVRDVEQRNRKRQESQKVVPLHASEDLDNIKEQLKTILKLPVELTSKGEKGQIIIHYNNLLELDELLSKLTRLQLVH